MQESITLTQTLTNLAELDRYNYWLYEQIAEAVGQRVLEVGSGTGNITQFLVTSGRTVAATDVVPNYRRILEEAFARQLNVTVGEFNLDKAAPDEYTQGGFDTVVCLNVLEHIENDLFALQQMRKALTVGGKLALLVPSHQFLYGEFDRAVGHFRRYDRKGLHKLLERAGFVVRQTKFFSMAAMLPWFINGRVLKRDYLPPNQADLANRLVPLLKLEKLIGPPCGISLIAIAEKP
ncbi:MAG: class I SAM-dependent methyltransferase [Acidobacteria bacterium]|nr:class I SAM-dependent methyltransferase [Acidobacteriota bacterium]